MQKKYNNIALYDLIIIYYFVSNVLTSTRCTYFIMRDRVLVQKEYPAYSLFKLDFFLSESMKRVGQRPPLASLTID